MGVHIDTYLGHVSLGVKVCVCVGGEVAVLHTDGVQRGPVPPSVSHCSVPLLLSLNPPRPSYVSPASSEENPMCPVPETLAGQAQSFLIATTKGIRASENGNRRDPESLLRASGQSLGTDYQSPRPPPWAHSRLHSPPSLVDR